MWGRRFLTGGLVAIAFDRFHTFMEMPEPAFQRIDFVPLTRNGLVQFLNGLFLMAQPDFEFREAGFRVGRRFFSVSGHGHFPCWSRASCLLASGERRFTAYSAFDASERVSKRWVINMRKGR